MPFAFKLVGAVLVLAVLGACVFACMSARSNGGREEPMVVDDGDDLRERLTPLQYQVTQACGTEPPFDNAYWDNKRHGIYVDVVSGEPLFSSLNKYDSGSGWPSFTAPLPATELVEREDTKLLHKRVEVRSKQADSHLGHVFNDGPSPGGLRYCINSAALRFVPLEDMAAQGFRAYLEPFRQAGLIPAED